MFVSFTDWEFDGNVDNAVEGIRVNWPEMKKYGAVKVIPPEISSVQK
jgi:hypothetical protein